MQQSLMWLHSICSAIDWCTVLMHLISIPCVCACVPLCASFMLTQSFDSTFSQTMEGFPQLNVSYNECVT